MNKVLKRALSLAVAATATVTCFFAGCTITSISGSSDSSSDGASAQTLEITSIEVTSSDSYSTTYTVTYSDGSTTEFTAEGSYSDISVAEVYEAYLEAENLTEDEYSYSDFLTSYLTYNNQTTVNNYTNYNTVTTTDSSYTVAENLLSVVSIYASSTVEVTTTSSHSGWGPGSGTTTTTTYDREVYTGSGAIYKITDDYVYIVTCYHVLYCETLESVANESIYMYLYGSEYDVKETTEQDTYGYIYDYGDSAIECEFVGGSWAEDVAVIKAATDDVLAINDSVKEVTFCNSYNVGGTALTIGNYAGEGISVKQGVISVDSEELDLTLGSTTNTFRVMRLDMDVYSGNSGGGLFDSNGYYIGLVNAMCMYFTSSTSGYYYYNYGYAIPATVVCYSIDNIMHYENGNMYSGDLGLEVESANSKYVYDENSSTGAITEDVVVSSVTSGSAAATMGIETGDIITSVNIDGVDYAITRTFNIEDIKLEIFENSSVVITYTRGGVSATTDTYVVTSGSISKL